MGQHKFIDNDRNNFGSCLRWFWLLFPLSAFHQTTSRMFVLSCLMSSLGHVPGTHTFPLAGHTSRHQPPYEANESNVYGRFNLSSCSRLSCRIDHICLSCSKPGHSGVPCPDGRLKSGVSRAKSGERTVANTVPNSTSSMKKL